MTGEKWFKRSEAADGNSACGLVCMGKGICSVNTIMPCSVFGVRCSVFGVRCSVFGQGLYRENSMCQGVFWENADFFCSWIHFFLPQFVGSTGSPTPEPIPSCWAMPASGPPKQLLYIIMHSGGLSSFRVGFLWKNCHTDSENLRFSCVGVVCLRIKCENSSLAPRFCVAKSNPCGNLKVRSVFLQRSFQQLRNKSDLWSVLHGSNWKVGSRHLRICL